MIFLEVALIWKEYGARALVSCIVLYNTYYTYVLVLVRAAQQEAAAPTGGESEFPLNEFSRPDF